MAAILGVAAILLMRFGGRRPVPESIGAIVGFLISVILLQLAWKMRSVRLALMCWLVFAAGIAVLMAGVPHDSQMIYVFLAAGVVCVIDGFLRMREFVRQHPLPAGEGL
jgi:chromate transport protein ChrA